MLLKTPRARALALAVVAVPSLAIAQIQPVVAVLDAFGDTGGATAANSMTRRSVVFYDPANLDGSPLFSVFVGYEDPGQSNYEDPGAITVNPYNGDVYVLSFDSGTPGTVSPGDANGDYDLSRINYGAVYADWLANGKAYALYTPNGAVPTNAGSAVRMLPTAISKVGEVARNQSEEFYDYDMEFVTKNQLVVLDNQTGPDASGDAPANDHTILGVNRTSTSPDTFSSETWQSNVLGLVNLDFDAPTGMLVGRSEPIDISYIKKDGVEGVWVVESDGGGDDVAFFQITNYAGTSGNAYRQLAGTGNRSFALDDPSTAGGRPDGSADWIIVDRLTGELLVGESGFFESPQTEPSVLRFAVASYDAAGQIDINTTPVEVGPLDVSGAIDDDTAVTDGRFVAYDKATGEIIYFDIDGGADPAATRNVDAYTLSLNTGATALESLNGLPHFTERHGNRWFLRGDFTLDGQITAVDIDTLGAALSTDSDFSLNGNETTEMADVNLLVRSILNTEFGDANLDGRVDVTDLGALAANFRGVGGWAMGDFNLDGVIDVSDLGILASNFRFMRGGTLAGGPDFETARIAFGLPAVPEPAALGLALLPAALLRRRRH